MAIHLPAEEYIHKFNSNGKKVTYCTMRHIVLHTIGLDGERHHRPYHRHGKCFYRPWRNYFNTYLGDKTWEALEREGYAAHGEVYKHQDLPDSTDYYLTRKGLNWLGKELGMTIYDEED